MPQQADLMGLGMPSPLAATLGNTTQALTATGSAQSDAAAIRTHLVVLTATGADGIILPIISLIGTPFFVFNSSGSDGLVYCPVGHTMNGTTNGSATATSHKLTVFIQQAKGKWSSLVV